MQLQIKIGETYYPIANPQHTMLWAGMPGVGKSRLIEPLIGSFLSKSSEASLFRWVGDRSKKTVVLVETEQPEDLVQAARDRIQTYSKLNDKDFNKKFITLPVSEIKGGVERRAHIKNTLLGVKDLGLLTIDNLTGIVNNVNSEVESAEVNHLVSVTSKEKNSISLLISHLTNGDKTPLGHVGKNAERDCSSQFTLLKDSFSGITVVQKKKNRLDNNLPDFHFTVSKDFVIPGVYMPFP